MRLDSLIHSLRYSLRDIVFGMEDSVITTLGVVLGVGSSGASPHAVLVAGAATVIGGLISIGAGEYIATKSQVELLKQEVADERLRLKRYPEHELKELERRYERHGFSKAEAALFIRQFSRHKKLLLRSLLAEELGILPERFDSPGRNALVLSVAYIIGGLVPLVPFLLFSKGGALPAAVLSMAALFAVGAWKTAATRRSWLRSGLEMLAVGLFAAAAGWLFGTFYGV